MKISGQIIDVVNERIYPGTVIINGKLIADIREEEQAPEHYIMPGLIDAHIHIESSMSTPGAFAVEAVSRGTTGVVSDPHEIANVLGIDGVKYMIEDASRVPLKFWFGAPSCVPATTFESSGAHIGPEDIKALLALPEIKYLAEMMNFPGVIFGDKEVHEKLKAAKSSGKPIDGHAPGLRGPELKKYIEAGITTDHECSTMEEAEEKIKLGMKVLIREGSAARNLNGLKKLISSSNDMVMLCSDDLHPEMLTKRHLDKIVSQLLHEGFDLFDVLKCCTINPARHYNLDAGLLTPGSPADFTIAGDYRKMNVLETWIDGSKVYDRGKNLFIYTGGKRVNYFNSSFICEKDIEMKSIGGKMRVIEAYDGELGTKEIQHNVKQQNIVEADINADILKIVVKDRYLDAKPAIGFIRGFGLKNGAFASSVAHDSHNVICIGTTDREIVAAINEVVRINGGLSVAEGQNIFSLPLPVAGIMTDAPVAETAAKYESLSEQVQSLGCMMSAPFMTLSFMALLVIPELKLSDKGLFDGRSFRHVPLFLD